MKLLHLDSSIQGQASVSRRVSAAIVEHLRVSRPDLEVTYRDLASAPVTHLTLDAFASAEAQAILEQFLATDVLVMGVALYNFTVPSQLKAWLDRILVAGRTFRYGEHGPEGLAGGKRVIVALSRGGRYGEGSPFASYEHAESYLRRVFAFIGVHQPEFIVSEGVALGDEARQAAIASALDQASRVRVEASAA